MAREDKIAEQASTLIQQRLGIFLEDCIQVALEREPVYWWTKVRLNRNRPLQRGDKLGAAEVQEADEPVDGWQFVRLKGTEPRDIVAL